MVLLPTAVPGILTGVMLAIARGPAKPLPCSSHRCSALLADMARPRQAYAANRIVAVLIYNFAGMPFANQVELAWAAALVLVLMVLTANLIGKASRASKLFWPASCLTGGIIDAEFRTCPC